MNMILAQSLQQKYKNDAGVVILILSCGTLEDLTFHTRVLHILTLWSGGNKKDTHT